MTSQAIVSYFWCSQTFSIFTQYMSVSHGYSTIGGIEWWLWRRQKGEDSLTSTRRINGLWRCPLIDINVSEYGLPCNGCTRAMNAQQKKTSGCASNSLAHEDLGQFEEAHHWNIQAKFYNEKFPLVYESDKTRDSLSWKLWCYFEAQLWKKDSNIVPSLFFSHFFGPSFFFLWPFFGQCSIEWWSSHFYLFATQWLQLDTRTEYDSIWMPPAVYRDMQWTKSDMYERIMNGGFATNTMSTTWSC